VTLSNDKRGRYLKYRSRCGLLIVMVLSLVAGIPFLPSAEPLFGEPHRQVSTSVHDPHQDAFQQGLVALKEDNLDAALGKLTEAEKERPSDARIRNFRGIVLARVGRSGEAASEYREAIRLDPQMEDPHRNLGFLEWTDRHLENARAELQRALELAPEDAFAHYYLGRVQLDAKLYSEAFRELDRSGVPWPSDAEFLMQAASGYSALGRQEEARKTAERLTAVQLSDTQSVRAASLLLSLHANKAAVDVLRRLQAKQSSPSAWALYDLALGYLLTGDYERAASTAHDSLAALKAADNTLFAAQSCSVLGIARAHLGDATAAVEALRKTTALAPAQEEHWLNLTRELMDLGRFADAISATQAGLAENPKSYTLHLRMGAAYLSTDRYSEAEEIFRQLVRAGDPLPTSYIGLAQVLLRTGRAADAVSELGTAEEKLGPNFLISYFRGLALNRAGKPAEAEVAFEEAVRLNPASAEAHLGLGKTQMALGRIKDASDELQQSLRLSPENVQARRLLTQAQRRSGEKTAAELHEGSVDEVPPATQEHLVDDFLLPQWQMPPAN
jgi:Flp pilus assembly protein TadD